MFSYLFGFLLLLLLLSGGRGEVRNVTFGIGDVTTVVMFVPELEGNSTAFLKTYQTSTHIYLIQVNSSSAIATHCLCRNGVVVPVIVGSRGCDSQEFGMAVESSNCAPTDEKASERALVLRRAWPYTFGSAACAALGGDETSCFGPVYLFRPNHQLPIPRPDMVTNVIMADMFWLGVITSAGPRGDAPALTIVSVKLPLIRVNETNCSDSSPASFEGYYEPFYGDASGSMLLNETRMFRNKVGIKQRLFPKRTTMDGLEHLVLGVVEDGSGALHQALHSSIAALPSNWLEELPLLVQFDSGCHALVTLEPLTDPSNPLELVDPEQLNDITFDKQKRNGFYFQTAICGYHISCLLPDLTLSHPFTPDGDIGGGTVDFTVGTDVRRDIFVPKDERWNDYQLSCDDFWPPNKAFRTFGQGYDEETGETQGGFVEPFIAATFQCQAPFPNPLAIQQNDGNAQVRYQQCYKLGGVTALASLDFCRRPIEAQFCKGGWLYFDERCFYKFNPVTDGKFRTSNSLADASCSSLFAPARALRLLDQDLKAWLSRFFVFARRVTPEGNEHVVNVGGKRCISFNYEASLVSQDQDVSNIQDVSCEEIMFPICAYHWKEYTVPFSEEKWDVKAIDIMKKGQPGVPHPGNQLQCNCLDGWGPPACGTPICGLNSVSGDGLLTQWFQKCYKHGSCVNGKPRSCGCDEGYGPDAEYTQLRGFDNSPCACPSAGTYEPFLSSTFTLNGTMYPVTREDQIPCGGSNAGECLIEPQLNTGTCRCRMRPVLNPDARVKEQPCTDGSMCTGVTALVPPDQVQHDGDIIGGQCNGIGFNCPSGEKLSEQRVYRSSMDMFGRSQCRKPSGKLISGCVCPSGWSGLACTCPVPKNVLQGILYRKMDNIQVEKTVYGLFAKREFVQRIKIARGGGCPEISKVFSQEGELPEKECSALTELSSADFLEWDCHSAAANRLLISSLGDPIQCQVQAFSEWFPPCGNNTNPYAGRFFANEFQRSFDVHIDPQPSDFASKGCTITHCMCDGEHTGAKCSAAISGYRLDVDKQATHAVVCGETTLPPRGRVDSVDGKCHCLKRFGTFESHFAGDACELENVLVEGTSEEFAVCNAPYGHPIRAKFPLGRCEYDLIDQQVDPLNKLFVNIQPDATERSSVFTVSNNETIVRLYDSSTDQWKFWILYKDQQISVESLQPFNDTQVVESCSYAPLPLNFSIVAETTIEQATIIQPRRIRANVTVWSVKFECDNPVVDFGTPACYTTAKETIPGVDGHWNIIPELDMCAPEWTTEINFAQLDYRLEYRCISEIKWELFARHEFEVLETGTYYQSLFLCFSLVGNSRTNEALAYGVLDESDPLDRVLLDVAEHLELIPPRQISQRHHTNVYGAFHGLFYRSVPGLSPFDKEWTMEHYVYIGSLLANQSCVDEVTGVIAERAFDGQTLDKIALTLYENTATENSAVFNSSDTELIPTRMITREDGQWGFNGLVGNPYIHLLNSSNSSLFTFYNRPGWMMTLPTGTQVVRKFSLNMSFPGAVAIQAFGPLGSVCSTFYRTFEAGDRVHFDGCGSALMEHEKRYTTLLRMNESLELLPGFNSLEPHHPITVVWWMDRDVPSYPLPQFKKGDVAITGRVTGYDGLFASLKQAVYVDHRWPANSVYEEQCLSQEGRVLRAINYSSPVDLAYLKSLYAAHLAPRFCSADWQCKGHARNQERHKCIFETEYTQSWLGGPQLEDSGALTGIEGGCVATEGFAPHPCKLCLDGYGPSTLKDTLDMQNFFNTTEEVERCSIPWDMEQKTETGACGGYGTPVIDSEVVDDFTIHLFEDNKTRRCEAVTLTNSTFAQELLLVETNDFVLGVMEYGTLLKVFDDRIFIEGDEFIITDRPSLNILKVEGLTTSSEYMIKCQPRLTSSTHNFKWTGYRFIDSKLSFWFTKLDYYL